MNFALVDDEQLLLCSLKEKLIAVLDSIGTDTHNIDCFSDADEFISGFNAGKYDIIILDIYMDGINGIDVAKKIREKDENVTLAFCTSSNEFASQSYDVNARDYLQKPITEEKLFKMLKRFNLEKIEKCRVVRLSDGFKVPLKSILYTEYINHSVEFHIKGQPPHTVRASQGDVEALLLPHKGFFVINKGCIVNFAQVKSIEAGEFKMQNGESVPIARRRYKDAEAAYTKYIFDKMIEEMGD